MDGCRSSSRLRARIPTASRDSSCERGIRGRRTKGTTPNFQLPTPKYRGVWELDLGRWELTARALRKRASYGRANTRTLAALLGFSSGATRLSDPATSDGPVVTATYCLPSTANVTGNPLTGEPRFTSHSTLPLRSSNARKRPLPPPAAH